MNAILMTYNYKNLTYTGIDNVYFLLINSSQQLTDKIQIYMRS